MPFKCRDARGFTMLEVLVALFIFTIIAIIMTHALHSVLQSQSMTEQRAARLAELQMAMLFIRHDLEQTVDRSITNTSGGIDAGLLGSSDKIDFTHNGMANPQGQLERSSLQRTSYYWRDNNLVRATWQVLDRTATSASAARTLLKNVTALHFKYLDDQGHYIDTWPPQNKPQNAGLPYAVKIFITLSHWGDLSQVYIIPGKAFVTPKT